MDLRRVLSIFSSDRTERRPRTTVQAVAMFSVVLAICAVAGDYSARQYPGLRPWFGTVAEPVDDDNSRFFLAGFESHLDHVILFRGFGRSMEFARQADVLLIGNSRVNFAFSDQALRRVAAESDIRFFSLGVGYGERFTYPLEIIRRFDLRPRAVVVNADGGYFTTGTSPIATRLMTQQSLTRAVWQDYKFVVESTLAFHVGQAVHRVVPRFYYAKIQPRLVIFRSQETGAWHWTAMAPITEQIPIANVIDGGQPLSEDEIQNAQAFKREMDSRGTAIILTHIPYGMMSQRKLQQLAEIFDAPIIVPTVDNLATIDKAHLTRDSAARFSTAFFEEFFSNPQVAVALGDKSKMNVAGSPGRVIQASHEAEPAIDGSKFPVRPAGHEVPLRR